MIPRTRAAIRSSIQTLACLLALLLLLAGCASGGGADATPAASPTATSGVALHGPSECSAGSIVALGSTALLPLVEAAAQAYNARCPAARVQAQGGGSGTGLAQVSQGGAAIGDSDIFAEQLDGIDPRTLTDTQVAVQAFVIVAHPAITVDSLTQSELVGIFTGKITNWKAVGGPDQEIALISRPFSSGTRITFRQYALGGQREAPSIGMTSDSTGAVARAIHDTPGAIGYLGLAYYRQHPDLRLIGFNGKEPTVPNISDDSYPIWSYGHMYTKGAPTGLTKAFLDYMQSDEIENRLVPQLGYIPMAQVRATKTP
jgi:phosphate transport system substrate-binding protein